MTAAPASTNQIARRTVRTGPLLMLIGMFIGMLLMLVAPWAQASSTAAIPSSTDSTISGTTTTITPSQTVTTTAPAVTEVPSTTPTNR